MDPCIYNNNSQMKTWLADLVKRETETSEAGIEQNGGTTRSPPDSAQSTSSADLHCALQRLSKCTEQGEKMSLSEGEVSDYAKDPLCGRNRDPCGQ